MAEGDPRPTPADPAAPKTGGWKAVLKDGRNVIVHEIALPPGEMAAVAVKVKRLTENRHPALAPILAWGSDATGLWIAVEPNEGTPLNMILRHGPFRAPTAAVLATSLLSGVAAMHQAGISIGGFDASAVKVNGNGDVRLVGHQAAVVRPAPSQADLRADVRSAGTIICAAFGVDPGGAAAPPELSPGLVVNIRSMAGGAVGPSAERAMGSFRETTGNLLNAAGQAAASSELATRQSGRETPSITPFITAPSPTLPAQYLEPRPVVEAAEPPERFTNVPPAASPEAPPPPIPESPATTTAPRPVWTPQAAAPRPTTVPRRSTARAAESSGRPAWQIPAYVALIVLVIAGLGAGIYFVTRPQSGNGPSADVTPSASSSAKPNPTPSPKQSPSPSTSVPKTVPVYAPDTAPPVKSVAIDPANSPCTLGGACTIEVDVFFAVGQADVAWSFKVFNRCTGVTDDLPGTHVVPHPDWIEVIGDANLNLPSGLKSVAIVAVTTTPAQAASKELDLGATSC